jgi:hypothetical protein
MEITQLVMAAVGTILEPTTGCQWRTSILPVTAAEIMIGRENFNPPQYFREF